MTDDATRDSGGDTPDPEPKYLLTITDAARALDVSVRTVQRRLDAGEYEAATLAGKRCVRLSASDFPDDVPEGVTLDATGDSVDRTALKSARDATGDSGHDSTAIVPFQGMGQVQVLAALLDAVEVERAARRDAERPLPTAQECAAKLLLSLDEVQVLTGLSRGVLRDAIATGALAGKKIGRGWKVRREDVEQFVKELF
jgi:excisionase family DNA binding protein